MTFEFQDTVQIATLCLFAVMGIGRAIVLKLKNIRVFVLDSQMSKTQHINGIFFVICFLIWIFESISYSLSLDCHIPLSVLDALIVQHIGIKIVGTVVLVFGLIIYAIALYSFRNSWRIGIDRETSGPLITNKIFKYSRNPIYVSLDLLVAGTFFLQGHFVFLLLFVTIAISLHIQILQEESFLIQSYGDYYLQYRSKVSRYINLKLLFR
jgi:protein-S-isoprenylcysteine O-methyltransferase Ste14